MIVPQEPAEEELEPEGTNFFPPSLNAESYYEFNVNDALDLQLSQYVIPLGNIKDDDLDPFTI